MPFISFYIPLYLKLISYWLLETFMDMDMFYYFKEINILLLLTARKPMI
jgi:hypothetical protein